MTNISLGNYGYEIWLPPIREGIFRTPNVKEHYKLMCKYCVKRKCNSCDVDKLIKRDEDD